MNITELSLTNFRNARTLKFSGDLAFDSRINVFYGINGAGKSTILDSIAILLSWFAARMKSPNGSGRSIRLEDINNGASSVAVGLSLNCSDTSFNWSIVKNSPGRQNVDSKSNFSGVNELCKALVENPDPVYPVLAFYPVTRAVVDIPLRIRNKHNFVGPLNTYENSLSSAANFRTFFEWFREREDLENEKLRECGTLQKDLQLEAVRSALDNFLPGFSELTVKRSPLRMEVNKNGYVLRVDQLSDGEKCLLALVGDLARRFAIANENKSINALDGKGVVLIDEIDLHLHPEWQRMMIPRLLETFPNCQFFISTHSPLVINQLKPENLFMLQNSGNELTVSRPDASYGKSSDRILEDLMTLRTTHPDEVYSDLKDIFRLISDGDTIKAKESIANLRDKGFNDPELKNAETLIRRRELIGK